MRLRHADLAVEPLRSILSLLLCTAACAQTFEVASLKPSGPGSDNRIEGGPGTSDPLRYTYTCATLEDLIVNAWNVEYFQVSSKTAIDRDQFDLLAKIPPGTSKEQFRLMLQNLLLERFRLKLHAVSRPFSGYALVLAKSGLRLGKPAAGFPVLPPDQPGIIANEFVRDGHVLVRMRVQQKPMSEIAQSFHVPGDGPIVDQTRLAGKYDFTLEYSYPAGRGAAPSEPPPAPAIFTAVQQLGLRLVSRRVPMPVIVIDSFDRVPSGN